MPDTTTPMSMLEEHELFTIEKLLDEYVDGDNHIPKIAWKRLLADYRTLQSRLVQARWDAISRDQTIKSLRAENERYREALEWYADHTIYEPAFANGGDDLDSHGMKSLAGIDSGNRARVALGEVDGEGE
jgi:hypothetical protein